jgi:ProP effector
VTIRNKKTAAMAARVRGIIAERFPWTFKGRGDDKPPLKVGICFDIQCVMPELSRKAVALALGDYTWGPTYARNLVAGAPRIDLDGLPSGVVTPREAEHAAIRMRLFEKTPPREPDESDAAISAAMASDPDWRHENPDWSAAELVDPRKDNP